MVSLVTMYQTKINCKQPGHYNVIFKPRVSNLKITTCLYSLTDKLHYRVNNQPPVQYPKIEHSMNYVSQEGPGVITTTQLFQFLGKEIDSQRCVKLLLKT